MGLWPSFHFLGLCPVVFCAVGLCPGRFCTVRFCNARFSLVTNRSTLSLNCAQIVLEFVSPPVNHRIVID